LGDDHCASPVPKLAAPPLPLPSILPSAGISPHLRPMPPRDPQPAEDPGQSNGAQVSPYRASQRPDLGDATREQYQMSHHPPDSERSSDPARPGRLSRTNRPRSIRIIGARPSLPAPPPRRACVAPSRQHPRRLGQGADVGVLHCIEEFEQVSVVIAQGTARRASWIC
jgi:hypothetical protein